MKKSNKILAVLLALVMMITAVPMMTAMAEGTGDHFHAYVLQDGATEATCTTDGQATYKCSCGDVKVAVTEALDHKLVGTYTVKDDVHSRYCDRCKKTIEYKHDYRFAVPADSANKDATCTEVGKQVYRCTCNKKVTKDVEKVNHTYETLLVDGDKHVGACSVCEKTITEAHTWAEEGVITKDAKCLADGEMTFTCTAKGCNATKKEKIEKGHVLPETATSVNDKEHEFKCERDCGHSTKEAHNFIVVVDVNKKPVGDEPTCKDTGSVTIKCNGCGYTDTLTLAKTKHEFVEYKNYSDGQHTQKCKNCDEVSYSDHTWDAGKETTPATCAKEGVKTFTCTACKATKTEAIAKTTEHTVTKWETVKAATCKEAGSEKGACTVCNEETTREIPKTSDHKWGAWTVQIPATPIAQGRKVRECEVCGDKQIDTVEYVAGDEVLLGDVNGNGEVTAVDARIVLQSVAELRVLTEKEKEAADMNNDGYVTAVDARIILQKVAAGE